MNLKSHYSHFLSKDKGLLRFTAHSHHYWPDVTRDAVLACWDDAAKYVDDKWSHIFGEVIPRAQSSIASILDLDHPDHIAFAPNTHEFVMRLLSAFDWTKPLRILTTDSEFHSFSRQISRLEELDTVSVERVRVFPFKNFESRFRKILAEQKFDLVFFSQVFFDSGFAIRDLSGIVSAVRYPDTVIVIDGYHGFCALPTSLRSIQERVFYLAGGYKYAQSGEGVCFLHIPQGCELRPMDTGWFAELGSIERPRSDTVSYSNDAFRFWGATFDPSGIYRFNAVMGWMDHAGLTVDKIHNHVSGLQDYFLEQIGSIDFPVLNSANQVTPSDHSKRGHFISYKADDISATVDALKKRGIIVDARYPYVRFGFGLYHDMGDIDEFIKRMRQ